MRGDQQMHWLDDGGDEDVYAEGKGTTQRRADGTVHSDKNMRMVPTEIFRARALLQWKGDGRRRGDRRRRTSCAGASTAS